MSLYGIETHICGVPRAMVPRDPANGHCQAVFPLDAGEKAKDGGKIQVFPIATPLANQSIAVIAEYTKTTDQATIEPPALLTAEPAQALSVQNYTSVASTASANFDQNEEV